MPHPRHMSPFDALYLRDADNPTVKIESVEGVKEPEGMFLKVMMVTDSMLVFRAWKARGKTDPWQVHDDHNSAATLLKGHLRMVIGDKEFFCKPGDAWQHPQGVWHMSEALEDCELIEIKSPPRKTWT